MDDRATNADRVGPRSEEMPWSRPDSDPLGDIRETAAFASAMWGTAKPMTLQDLLDARDAILARPR